MKPSTEALHTTGGPPPITPSSLYPLFQELQEAVNVSRAKVMASLQTEEPQYVQTSDKLTSVQKELKQLTKQLHEAELSLSSNASNIQTQLQTTPSAMTQRGTQLTAGIERHASTVSSAMATGGDTPREYNENEHRSSPSFGLEDRADTTAVTMGTRDNKNVCNNIQYDVLYKQANTLREVAEFLITLCQFQNVSAAFDKSIESDAYDIAAEHIVAVSEYVSALSSKSYSEEPDVVQTVKMEYLQRRGRLVAHLDEAMNRLFVFEHRKVTVRQSITQQVESEDAQMEGNLISLSDVLHAYRLLNLFDQRIITLSKQLISSTLRPMMDATTALQTNHYLIDAVNLHTEDSAAAWMWEERKQTSSEEETHHTNTSSTPQETIIPLLQSVLTFAYNHFFRGHPEAMEVFGRPVWSYLCKRLMHDLPPPSMRGAELMKEFEVAMLAIQLIRHTDTRLSEFVMKLKQSAYRERKVKLLSECREWFVSTDKKVIAVCDATEVGSFTLFERSLESDDVIMQDNEECDASQKKWGHLPHGLNEYLNSCLPSRKSNDNSIPLKKILQSLLQESDGFFRLPDCGVSSCVHNLVSAIHGLLVEAVNCVEMDQIDHARQLFLLVRETVSLFVLIRPTACKTLLLKDAQMAAIFFSDCVYLIYHLMMIPFTYGSRVSKAVSHFFFFLDLIVTLRKLQETFFVNMMKVMKEKISNAVENVGDLKRLALDENYRTAEYAVAEATGILKETSIAWRHILPNYVYRESFALLVNVLLKNLINKLFSIANMPQADISALGHLFESTAAQLEPLLIDPIVVKELNKELGSINNTAFSFNAYSKVDPNSNVSGKRMQTTAQKENVMNRENVESMKSDIAYWEAFELIRDLLEADFSAFLSRKAALQQNFSVEDIRKLLSLTPYLRMPVETALLQLTKS